MQNQGEFAAVQIVALLIFYGVIFAISIGIGCLIAWFMYRAAKSLPESYRSRVSPGQAFLLLIPLFGLVWIFIYTKNLSTAFQEFFHTQNIHADDCGEKLGMYWGIGTVCSIIPCLGIFASLASLVLMILYLVKVTECKNRVDALVLHPQAGQGPRKQLPYKENDNPFAPPR